LLLDCDEPSGTIDDASFCLYQDASCSATTAADCASSAHKLERSCACAGDAPPMPIITTTATATTKVGAKPPGTLYTLPPTNVIYPMGETRACPVGDATCRCTPSGTCADADAECIGRQRCPLDAPPECVNFDGVCVKPDCAGELGCSCNQNRCFEKLVCDGGACVEPLYPDSSPAPAALPPLSWRASLLLASAALVDRRLAVLTLASHALAHNWVNSPSRAAQVLLFVDVVHQSLPTNMAHVSLFLVGEYC
jgi:hypothetical protein